MSFEVLEVFDRVRADKVLHDQCSELSRNQVQRLFDEGLVWHDNEAINKSQRLSTGDIIYYSIPPLKKLVLEPVEIALDILYEDEHIAVINKATGMVVHPGNGTVHSGCPPSLTARAEAAPPPLPLPVDRRTFMPSVTPFS